ncbi:MAG: ATP--guanido phosphotransferase [Planctomycetota bacterium]|nr:ATP--guanido phosphotransferase [Planctomycetota bacterium]
MQSNPIEVRAFAERVNRWLDPNARDADVVISARARLARNVQGFKFPSHLCPDKASELCDVVRPVLQEARMDGDTMWVGMGEASPVLRLLLLERNLISRDLVNEETLGTCLPGRGLAFGHSETLSAMVGEEDHLRLCALTPGFDIRGALQRVRELDEVLEKDLPYAVNEELGYLTGCPTNVGTGLRASIMLHLPALGLVRSELQKVFTAAQHTGLAVRGMHGEGSRATGDFYQISNQVTLGRSEEDLIADLEALVPYIVGFERKVRESLLEEHRGPLHDRVAKSYGILRTTRSLATGEALAHISAVRLGLHLGLLPDLSLGAVDRLWTQLQKGHLQALSGHGDQDLIEASERDKLRASLIRTRLG